MTRRERVGTRRPAWRRAWSLKQTKIGGLLLILTLLLVAFGPFVAPHSATGFVDVPYAGPSHASWLGTDQLGRDVLSRTLHGGWSVVWMSALAGISGVLCGSVVGVTAGYVRGGTDTVIMRLADVVLAFPQLVLILVVVSMVGGSPALIVVLTAVAWIPGVARVMRGATLALTGREFVRSAEAMGYRRSSILLDELLPNLTAPLLVELGLRISWSIAVISAASFLGVGVQPPSADWGLMINENRSGVALQPWGVVAPTTCIAIFTIGASLVAEGFSRVLLRTESTVEA